jgi:riboflavin kinase/FMN adenylyltransferase
MRLFHGTDNAEIQRPTVLTLGVFDGLHLGHQLIMRTVVERARATGAVPTVITFDPHPRAVLHPESAPPLLQTFDQKIEAFGVLGIEQTIVVRFTKEFSSIRAEDFLNDVVVDRLHTKEVYLGKGFAFGHNREGNIELLKRMGDELGFVAGEVPEVKLRGSRVSSSKIRQLLAVRSILQGACWAAPMALKDASSAAQNAVTSWVFPRPTSTHTTASYPGTACTLPAR